MNAVFEAARGQWRRLSVVALAVVGIGLAGNASRAAEPRHGLAIVGAASPENFDHLPYADPDAPKGGKLRLGMLGAFDGLNRFNVNYVRSPLFLLGAVYETLMTRSEDEQKTYYGLVARSFEMDDARRRVTFHLDPRAHFSDGVPITSADVLFTFDLLKAKGAPRSRETFGLVKAAEIVDAHTILFDLTGTNDRELPLQLAALPVLPEHATDVEHFADASFAPPVASGPYLVADVRPGRRLVLRRDPSYWGKDLPVRRGLFNFDEIDVEYYRDADALFEAFKSGLVDFREETSAGRWASAYDFPSIEDGRVVKETIKPPRPVGIEGFLFNLRNEAFRDVRVREAIGMMLDFEWIDANYYSGLYRRTRSYFDESEFSSSGRPASAAEKRLLAQFPNVVREDVLEGRWRPPTHDGTARDRELSRHAQTLLQAAGYTLGGSGLVKDDAPLRFEILVGNRDEERLALSFSASLKKIGVDARVQLVDYVQFVRRRQQFDYDMLVARWLSVAAPGGEQRVHWSEIAMEAAGDFAGPASPAVSALIDSLLAAESQDDLIAAARALDRVLLSGFYFVPLYHASEIWTAHDARLRHPEKTPRYPMLPYDILLDNWWCEKRKINDPR